MSSISIPNPLDSDQEFYRYYHHDLADMEIEDLLGELYSRRCQLWLLKSNRFSRMVSPFEQRRRAEWLRERISRVEAELRKRRYAAQELRSRPKPKPVLSQGVKL